MTDEFFNSHLTLDNRLRVTIFIPAGATEVPCVADAPFPGPNACNCAAGNIDVGIQNVGVTWTPTCDPPDCDDGNPCTTDSCNAGVCQHVNNSAACNDGLFCNGTDTCSGGSCSQHSGNPCTSQGLACNETTNQCVCAQGSIESVDPPDGTIDARQPHPIDDSSHDARQGIGSLNSYTGGPEPITISLGQTGAANLSCWELCETGIEPVDEGTPALDVNFIADVTETSFGVYELLLDRPISGRHWTTITNSPSGDEVSFASLPGDVNSDGTSNPALDMTALIDCLNNPGTCTEWQQNINHDSAASGLDLTRLIDLFNGAGTFISWTGATLPTNICAGMGEAASPGGEPAESSASSQSGTSAAVSHGELADWFMDWMTGALPSDGFGETEWEEAVWAVAGWFADHFPMEEREALAARLEDPSMKFNDSAAELIPGIIDLLRP